MAKHVYYKKSKRLYLPFVGKMDKQARLEKKREQRLCRETSARVDHFISDYVQHKYAKIYAEAKEYHDHLRSIYTTKHDLRKTPEFIIWKKQIQQSPTQGAANREHVDNMELKIQLIECKKTTTAIETTSSINTSSNNEIAEENIAPTEGTMEGIETTSSINTSSNNEIAEESIAPSINEEIPTELLEEIITELSADSYLNDIFTDFDFDFEMLGCNINEHALEDQLL